MPRWFTRKMGTRQNAAVVDVEGIRSVGQCSVKCVEKAQECVGFNFKRGPVMCQHSGVPHDAPNTDMLADPTWDHYAILP